MALSGAHFDRRRARRRRPHRDGSAIECPAHRRQRGDLRCHCLLRAEIPKNEDGLAIPDLADSHPVVPYPRVCLRRVLDPTAVLRGLPADRWGELRVRARAPGRGHDRTGLLVDVPGPQLAYTATRW